MSKMKRWLAALLAIMLVTSGVNISEAADLPSHVIINQVYGRADKTDAAISHSFIELYNPTETDVDLSGYSVQYAKAGSTWEKLVLTGVTIGSYTSFLIRCSSEDGLASRYVIGNHDLDWSDCVISNDAMKVALVSNQTLLTVSNPTSEQGVVDFIGAGTTDYAYGSAITGISKQKTARRKNFANTGNNASDFEILDYRVDGIDDVKLETVRPRYSGDGKWGEGITPEETVADDKKLVFSHEAGLYSQAFELEMTTGYQNGIIRYTTDGSDPTESSAAYTAPIKMEERTNDANVLSAITNITSGGGGGGMGGGSSYTAPTTKVFKGNVIKAQVFAQDGTALTGVFTKSFFINPNYGNLSVISLVTDKSNFFDNTTGLYVNGNYQYSGSDWERPVHFEMFESDGSVAVSQNMGVRINGGTTRSLAQKALRLYAKKGYDAENPTVEYDLFEGRAKNIDGDIMTSFKRFLLRSSGNDNSSTMIRDAMMQNLLHDTNVMIQAYRQTVVFINGEFWGVYNIRERIDDESIMRKYHIDDTANIGMLTFGNGSNNVPDDYDTTDAGMVADYQAYTTMYNWFNSTSSLASDANYLKARTYIDIDNFIDYYIANIFVNNNDWPGNNNQLWRYRTSYPDTSELSEDNYQDGRWRWLLKDTDWGFGLQNGTASTNSLSRLTATTGLDSFNPTWSTLFYRRLITNETFKNKFVNRFCDLMNTNFKADVATVLINTMANNISGVMTQHVNRWRTISSVTTWNSNISTMKTFANSRVSYMQTYLKSAFSLSNTAVINLTTDKAMGYMQINGMDITTKTDGVTDPSSWSGTYFINKTQTISAVPYKGYKFSKFIVGATEYDTDTITITPTGATTVQAVFVEDDAADDDPTPSSAVIINQVYGRADKTDAAISHSFIELYNPTDADIDLSAYSVQYTKTGSSWQKLNLTGVTIGSHASILIRCYTEDGLASRYVIGDYDLDWPDCAINNDAFKVALVINQTLLTVSNPTSEQGVVDFIGAGTTDYAYGSPITGVSKQKTARRKDFANTGNNDLDFEILDYRSAGIDDATLEAVRPRYSGDGEWENGNTDPYIPEVTDSPVIINQVYGRADKTDAAISHSFIELYNPTDADVDLSTYSVQYTKTGSSWQKLNLTGVTIGSHASILIRCYTEDGLASRYVIEDYDLDWPDCAINNDAFKVALVINQTLLTVSNPTSEQGVVDFIGAGTTDYAYGSPVTGISKQKAARRKDFANTGNNDLDFEILDYRSNGIDDATLEAVRPRYSGDGEWGEDVTPGDPDPVPPSIMTESLPDGAVNVSYTKALEVAGDSVITWSITEGNLPDGLSLSSDGIISGMPIKAGTYEFSVKAENNAGSDIKNLSIFISTVLTSWSVTSTAGTGGSVSGGGTYNSGTQVTVTAVPDNGYTFEGWYENDVKISGEENYTFAVTSDRTLEARFSLERYTVDVTGATGGSVSGGNTYDSGIQVTVTAVPDDGYTFEGWYENGVKISGEENYTFAVTSDRTLEARFSLERYTADVTGATGGSVSGGNTYDSGTQVTVTAVPDDGYTFEGWYENDVKISGEENYTFTITSGRTLEARFSLERYTVTATAGTGGSVTGSGTYDYGTRITLTAAPKTGYRFVRWLEGANQVSVNTQYTLSVTKDQTLKAEFEKLGIPTSVKVKSAGYNSLTLIWKKVSGASRYEIYRAVSKNGSYTKTKTVSTTSYTDTKRTTGKQYYYKVCAVYAEGSSTVRSDYSDTVSAKPVLAKISGLKVNKLSTVKSKLSWKKVKGATGYEVYRKSAKKGKFIKVTTVKRKNYTDGGLLTGKTYYYKVRAYRLVNGKKVRGKFSVVRKVKI